MRFIDAFQLLFKKIFFCFFLLTPCFGFALQTDPKEPLHIQSKSASFDDAHHHATFTGKVVLDQGSTHIEGDLLHLYADEHNRIIRAVISGNLASYSTRTDGKPTPLIAKALQIEFFPVQHLVKLRGKAYAEQDLQQITGEEMEYHIEEHRLLSKGSSSQQSTLILSPKTEE